MALPDPNPDEHCNMDPDPDAAPTNLYVKLHDPCPFVHNFIVVFYTLLLTVLYKLRRQKCKNSTFGLTAKADSVPDLGPDPDVSE
jgi:hypothetical protein